MKEEPSSEIFYDPQRVDHLFGRLIQVLVENETTIEEDMLATTMALALVIYRVYETSGEDVVPDVVKLLTQFVRDVRRHKAQDAAPGNGTG